MALPDFILVGAPKAGTTALHAALDQHPQLHLARVKEPKYFLCGDRRPDRSVQQGPGDAHSAQEWVWNRGDYQALFDGAAPGQLRGESTPLYLRDFAAHDRMAEVVPGAKLIVVVRDPVDRAYSNWAHLWSDGLEPEADFMRAFHLEQERIDRGWAPFWRYRELGLYGSQLEHLYSVFPRDQVHVLRYRELVDEPVPTLDGICRFLGVDTGLLDLVPSENVSTFVADTEVNRMLATAIRAGAARGAHLPPRVWRRASVPLLWALKRQHADRPDLAPSPRAELVATFADDIALLSRLTGESYDDWLGYRAGGTYSVRRSRAAAASA